MSLFTIENHVSTAPVLTKMAPNWAIIGYRRYFGRRHVLLARNRQKKTNPKKQKTKQNPNWFHAVQRVQWWWLESQVHEGYSGGLTTQRVSLECEHLSSSIARTLVEVSLFDSNSRPNIAEYGIVSLTVCHQCGLYAIAVVQSFLGACGMCRWP